MARCQPNPHAVRYRDHRRPKTSSTRPSASASTLASTQMRLPPPRSISIKPIFRAAERTECGGVCAVASCMTTRDDADVATWTGIRRGTAGAPSPSTLASRRQTKIRDRETPCLRATSETFAPGAKLSSVIRAFSSSDQRRRRSTPSKISTRIGVYTTLSTSLRSYSSPIKKNKQGGIRRMNTQKLSGESGEGIIIPRRGLRGSRRPMRRLCASGAWSLLRWRFSSGCSPCVLSW